MNLHIRPFFWILLCLGVLVSGGALYLITRPAPERVMAVATVTEILAGDETQGFARALSPRPFSFPADWGPHPEYQIEWWYTTGNLETETGRHFGYQLTFFRLALTPEAVERESAWGTNQLYLAHFALTDVRGGRTYAFERRSRGALGLAGGLAQPFSVWVGNWTATAIVADTGSGASPLSDALPLNLRAARDGIEIDLTLTSAKPIVRQGNQGLSQKSADAGNASYYYSLTRMPTQGTIQVDGKSFQVQGLSWLDREWSTSALGADLVGWDWFALQMSDGREVMFYQLRKRDGSAAPFSRGTLILGDGETRPLTRDAVAIAVLSRWQSPLDDTRYPARWRMDLPNEAMTLWIAPYLANQELNLSFRYWEGAVKVTGTRQGQPIDGWGYVELTGYGERE